MKTITCYVYRPTNSQSRESSAPDWVYTDRHNLGLLKSYHRRIIRGATSFLDMGLRVPGWLLNHFTTNCMPYHDPYLDPEAQDALGDLDYLYYLDDMDVRGRKLELPA